MLRGAAFKPIRIRDVAFKNRFMCSPCHLGDCTADGLPKESYIQHLVEMAKGDCGLIVPGFCYTQEIGKAIEYQVALCNDSHATIWRDIITKIHSYGSRFIFQVCHAGLRAVPTADGSPIVGPSENGEGTRAMTKQEIEETIQKFKEAALLCKKAGADGIELHAAHGFLIGQFLSPFFNKRTDEYGGSIENRARILHEIVHEIKSVCDSSFLLTAKINGSDCQVGSLDAKDYGEILRLVPGFDFVEITCGIHEEALRTKKMKYIPKNLSQDRQQTIRKYYEDLPRAQNFSPLYNLDFARTIKAANPNLRISLVGGIRKLSEMNQLIESGDADFVSFGRPFMRQPQLVKDLANGANKVDCINCSMCYALLYKYPPAKCVFTQ